MVPNLESISTLSTLICIWLLMFTQYARHAIQQNIIEDSVIYVRLRQKHHIPMNIKEIVKPDARITTNVINYLKEANLLHKI